MDKAPAPSKVSTDTAPIQPAEVSLNTIHSVSNKTESQPDTSKQSFRTEEYIPASTPNEHSPITKTSHLPLFAGLGALLLCAFVILPWWLNQSDTSSQSQHNENNLTEITTQSSSNSEPAPWQATQAAQSRRTAQEILAEALAKRDQLQQMSIEQWGQEAYEQALALAETGDEFYKSRDFETAIDHYQQMLAGLTTLLENSSAIAEQWVQKGREALTQKDPATAQTAFANALMIEPENSLAKSGASQAEKLPEILTLWQSAKQKSRKKNLTGALADLAEAQSIASSTNSDYPWLTEQYSKTESAQNDQQFNSIMSMGFQALNSGDITVAKKAFQQAIQLKPDAENARNAFVQAKVQEQEKSLKALLRKARKAEKEEDWNTALSLYTEAIELDKNQAAATVRKLKAEARLKLDTQLQLYLNDPMQLTQSDKLAAKTWLKEARKITDAGPKLKQQRTKLRELVNSSNTPRTVILQSDGLSQIKISKVNEFSAFTETSLRLKPGHYVAVAQRDGYRDVRKPFTVPLESTTKNDIEASVLTVYIACEEKLALGPDNTN